MRQRYLAGPGYAATAGQPGVRDRVVRRAKRALRDKRRDNAPFNIYDQPLWLMRGQDKSEKNDFAHGHDIWNRRYASGLGVGSGSAG